MPDDKDDKPKDDDKTPLPFGEARRRSSKSMRAFGMHRCPVCTRPGPSGGPDDAIIDHRVECDLCFDPDEKIYLRKITVDVWIAWNQRQHQKK